MTSLPPGAAAGGARAADDSPAPSADDTLPQSATEVAMPRPMQLSLAPEQLWQAINPWSFYQQGAQFGLVNIQLGRTPNPQLEQTILEEVGSYGRQIGRLGDALEVLLRHVKLDGLTQQEADALDMLRGQLAEIRRIKQRGPA
ncbi:hypothetical protein [Falsiroseomonas tokyonensis]|uniref:Uncharacterized protein n=1 Tax=Falsiroseomonas tokyonensis TaxID=430521 RepID=A0ABV7BZ53_9PROT|nr:hypothetical protein [Falsiroseomonas tokyonensis]MBU8540142.1 hypothetical protein [Falsiroseomonas tokyonensis]